MLLFGGGTCDDRGVSTSSVAPSSAEPVALSSTEPVARLPLRRPRRGRLLGGVCAGLAAHLGQPVVVVRIAMVVAAVVGGAGAVLYVWLWITVPAGDPLDAALAERSVAMNRLAP